MKAPCIFQDCKFIYLAPKLAKIKLKTYKIWWTATLTHQTTMAFIASHLGRHAHCVTKVCQIRQNQHK